MNTLLKVIFILAILTVAMKAESSTEKSAFTVTSTITNSSIPIDGTVTLNLVLNYPEGFRPDIERIKERILSYNGQGEPPFNLKIVDTGKPEKDNGLIKHKISYTLQPQAMGKYYLSPKVINFIHEGSKEEKITIPAPFFEVIITDIAEISPTEAMIAPFLNFDTRLPITMSYENKIHLLTNHNNSHSKDNIANAISSKSIPWATILALCATALTFLLIAAIPYTNRKEKKEKEDIEQRKKEIKNMLRKLSEFVPQTTQEASAYITNIENSLKQLLETNFSINASTETTEELFGDINALKKIPPSMKIQLMEIFETDDKIKFAKYPPARKDAASAAKTAAKAAELL